MASFKQSVNGMIEVVNNQPKFKLTAEQREALKSIETVDSVTTYQDAGVGAVQRSVALDKAIEAFVSGSNTNASTVAIVADHIESVGFDKVQKKYPCTVAKVTNVQTANITEAAVKKLYAECMYTEQSRSRGAVSNLRTEYEFAFNKPQAMTDDDIKDGVTRKSAYANLSLSATVIPGSMVYDKQLETLINRQHKLKLIMITEFLRFKATNGLDDMQLLTIYRQINRSLAEEIFDIVYEGAYGQVDFADTAAVKTYLDLRETYNKSLRTVGSVLANSDTIQFGINVRDMSIAVDPKWSSVKKLGKVKQFEGKSYYVSNGTDVGYQTIPTTADILKKYQADICAIVDDSMALVEQEARAEHGYTHKLEMKSKDYSIENVDPHYYQHLGITPEKESAVLRELEDRLVKLATDVVQNARSNANMEAARDLSALMNGGN